MKWTRFRPHLYTYRINWARGTSWGWWDEWDDTALQIQDLKSEPWRSAAEHALSFTEAPHNIEYLRVSGKKHFVSCKLEGQSGVQTRDLRLSKQATLTTAPGVPFLNSYRLSIQFYQKAVSVYLQSKQIHHFDGYFFKNVLLRPINIGGIEIEPSVSAHNLGVMFDKHLNMCENVNQICKNNTISFEQDRWH